jgi:uncharacterized protein (TIGR02147 family)
MIDIFSYTNYRQYLKEACEEIRETKPFFSYRYIAQKAGLKSVGFISWVIKGKRNMSASLTHKIGDILKLSKREAEYFDLLVSHNQAKKNEERQYYLNRLLAFRSTRTTIIERDRDQYYSRWYYSAIRELVNLTEIRDEKQVVKLLRPTISRLEARGALSLLERLEMIKRAGNQVDGAYERVDAALISGPSVDPAIIHGFQTSTMRLAEAALHEFPKEDRDISTVTLSCNSKDLERVRERIRQMRDEITEIACASEDADGVYQLNTQFFPLTKKISRDDR